MKLKKILKIKQEQLDKITKGLKKLKNSKS